MESKLRSIQDEVKEAGLKISRMLGPRAMTGVKAPYLDRLSAEHSKVIVGADAAES
jgi:hypothetical protein